MQCSVPFVQQSLCLQRWDNGLQWWVYNGCTVRFVFRIFEYSFILGIFDSSGFRIFVLALQFLLALSMKKENRALVVYSENYPGKFGIS